MLGWAFRLLRGGIAKASGEGAKIAAAQNGVKGAAKTAVGKTAEKIAAGKVEAAVGGTVITLAGIAVLFGAYTGWKSLEEWGQLGLDTAQKVVDGSAGALKAAGKKADEAFTQIAGIAVFGAVVSIGVGAYVILKKRR